MNFNRRQWLALSSSFLAGRISGAPDSRAGLITLSPQPPDLEMRPAGFLDEITPVAHFFVRSHTLVPRVELSRWNLKLDGRVRSPLSLTLPDLKQFPRVELASVLECAGNGRAFYQPHLPGAQWKFGSVGNAVWAGARLRDVLQKAGLQEGAKHLLLDGADVPLGKMPDFQRTIPVEKALHPDTLLAYEMNGKPLTAEHGFPLRLVAPGWAGDSWVKWLQHIEVLDHEFEGFWMKTAYRHPRMHVEPGSSVDPKDMVPVTDLNVKSAIAVPGPWTKPGSVTIRGVAWSNASPVTKVDVSTDGGQTWHAAQLGGKPTRYGFRSWRYPWRASAGSFELMSRATNAAGQTQPLAEEWNPSGYLWNVSQKMLVVVADAAPPVSQAAETTLPEYPAGYKVACIGCHDEHMMTQQHLTRAQWDKELNKMAGWGAPIQPDQRSAILDYLAARFKPE